MKIFNFSDEIWNLDSWRKYRICKHLTLGSNPGGQVGILSFLSRGWAFSLDFDIFSGTNKNCAPGLIFLALFCLFREKFFVQTFVPQLNFKRRLK